MSDYLLPPVIENALIVLLELPEQAEEIAASAGLTFLKSLAGLDSATAYIFVRPVEALEALDDTWPQAMDSFALAAQVEETQDAAWHGAIRRVFSRATVRRAVILDRPTTAITSEVIRTCFRLLENHDVLLHEVDGTLVGGFTSYDPDFFSEPAEDAQRLMKRIGGVATAKGLRMTVEPAA